MQNWNTLLCFTEDVNLKCSFIFNACIFITRLIKVQVNLLLSKGEQSPRYSTLQDFSFSSECDLDDQDTK